jgi:hypothetical protein
LSIWRGAAISITEDKEEGFFRMSTDFIYRREDKSGQMTSFEKPISGLFGSRDEVRLSDLKDKFYQYLPGIKTAMYNELIQLGYYRENPEKVRTVRVHRRLLMGVAVALGFVGLLFLVTLPLPPYAQALACS